jgi:hypothetical protein
MALTQYGGARAPAVEPQSGGAAVFSNMASGAFGMLTAGGLPAIQAAMDVAKEGTTTQTAGGGTNTNSFGSKVFNAPGAGDGMAANSFWQATVKQSANGSTMILLAVLVVAGAWYFIARKR